MIPGLPLAFAYPWLLAALVLLPAIWWLLRFTPPRPVRVAFPPTRILLELDPREETRAQTPWWLVLLRVLIAALVIFALARPILNPPTVVATGSGPLMVLLDDGWGSGPNWDRMAATTDQLLAQAESDQRTVLLVATASDRTAGPPADASDARERLAGLVPSSHAPERGRLADAVMEAASQHGVDEIVWMSDGLEHGSGAALTDRLATAAETANVRIVRPEASGLPLALAPAVSESGGLTATALRASAAGVASGNVMARDSRGRAIGEAPFIFGEGETTTTTQFDLPVEIRNDIARLEIAVQRSSGSVQLLDDRWKRRVVGLVSGESREAAQPLLSPLYYITRALRPFADLREARESSTPAAINALVEDRVSVLLLADIGNVIGDAEIRLQEWIAEGGVLLRFAGPRLAGAEEDELVPTPLRSGERELGGTLSWSEPQALAEFPSESPFAGLPVPADVQVTRQVLAEPAVDLAERTWASLADGTPLVTGARLGQGWVVLFHVTADAAWSNLPLSGVFVEMLQRVVNLSGAGGDGAQPTGRNVENVVLRPLRTLDATGALVSPPDGARPIESGAFADARPTAEHPPGLYGEQEAFKALNVIASPDEHVALNVAELPVSNYPVDDPRSIGPWLLALAVMLLIVDGIAMLLLSGRGLLPRRTARAGAGLAIMFALVILGAPNAALAQDEDETFALEASLKTRLAYVVTGNSEIDETSRAGLFGLSEMLAGRTALEPAAPLGVDISQDELAFFPLIYWPIDHGGQAPTPEVLARIDAYMKQGGTILFDTRDELETAPGSGAVGSGMMQLRSMLRGLDIPQLEPTPADHVLTKAFYLLQDFPGRWEGGTLWVEAAFRDPDSAQRPAHNADGVSSIMITSNDFASAWAIDESRRPLYPVSPGGDWQREMSYRSGINIVMYALTGNYKADQVHVPALLERLGQ